MQRDEFSISRRIQSFKYAFNGLKVLIKEEDNAKVHLVVTILVIMFSLMLKLDVYEWIAVLFCIGFVFVAEIFNSAIENISDFVSPAWTDKIKKVKDLAAAAVVVSVMVAVVVGLLVFVPKIF